MTFSRLCTHGLLSLFLALVIGSVPASGQNRDFRTERIILDDGGADGTSNTLTLDPQNLTSDVTLMIPQPTGASGEFLISNPMGSSNQSINGPLTVEELRIMTSGSFYTSFLTGAQTANLSYTLPIAAPSAGQVLTSNGSGVLRWDDAGLASFTEAYATAAPNATVPVASLTATGTATHIDAAFVPKGNGALLVDVPDNAAAGGNKRGAWAVDLQTKRTAATQVASGSSATISGGGSNTAAGNFATVGGGEENGAGGQYGVIAGGRTNDINPVADYGTIAGGSSNTINEDFGSIGGGINNTIFGSANSATIGGGSGNVASSTSTTVAGGSNNTASNLNATVGGGLGNSATGENSVVPGGYQMTVSGNGSFGFQSVSSGRAMSVAAFNTAVFSNADLWLANNDNSPSELRFYEAYNTAGPFPNTAKYTGFKAPTAMTSVGDVLYTLPTDAPASNGQVLSSTTAGVMSWVSAGLTNFTESYDGTNDIAGLTPSGAATNIGVMLAPKGNGALQVSVTDGLSTGGNARGAEATDWQRSRNAATQVASGIASTIVGGQRNTASGNYSTAMGYRSVAGGEGSMAAGWSANAGGHYSMAMGVNATASGSTSLAIGESTTASGSHSIALGQAVSTNLNSGSFVFGDLSTATVMNATTTNQMSARFENGYRFFTDATTTEAAGLFIDGSGNLGVGEDAPTAKVHAVNNSAAASTLELSNTNATGVGLEIADGRMIASASTANSAGGTVPSDVIIARVADNTTASNAPATTLPTTVADGQILYLVVEDPDGATFTGTTLKAGAAPTADGLYILVYYNDGTTSGWAVTR